VAKKCMIAKEKQKKETVNKFKLKRDKIKAVIKSPSSTDEEKEIAIKQLQKLPRNSSPCRGRNRCNLTGRPHGFYRKFGLSRNKLREAAMRGDIPGLVKASW